MVTDICVVLLPLILNHIDGDICAHDKNEEEEKLGCLKYKGPFVTGWYGSPATDPRFATEYCEFSPFLVLCAFFQRIL